MSLQLNLPANKNRFNVNFENAIAKIYKVETNTKKVKIDLFYFANIEAKNKADEQLEIMFNMNPQNALKYQKFEFDLDDLDEVIGDSNIVDVVNCFNDYIKRICYLKLKTLKEFENATDI